MKIKYSIIIPQRNSLDTLPRLFNSIPKREDIEIILIDNTPDPISREDVGVDRCYQLLHASPERFAGGARNVGIENANGEWLLFCDADDFFYKGAFDKFDQYAETNYDLVYFKANSVYDDTLEPSNRADLFSNLVDDYLQSKIDEMSCRLYYAVPWGKMVKRSLVEDNHIRFDEVIAANDVYFSTLTGFYAKKFTVSEGIVYTVTVRKGSLTQIRSYNNLKSRYKVFLRRNKFFKEHGLDKMQISVMYHIYNSVRFGIDKTIYFLWEAMKYRQNIFIGAKSWFKTKSEINEKEKKEKKYLVK